MSSRNLEVQIRHNKKFYAFGEVFTPDGRTKATIIGDYTEYQTGSVNCQILAEDGLEPLKLGLARNWFAVQFQGTAGPNEDIWIPKFNISKLSGKQIEGEAEVFAIGRLGETVREDDKVHVVLFITRSPLLSVFPGRYTPQSDGSLIAQDVQSEDVSWRLPTGEEVKLSNSYGFVGTMAGSNNTYTQLTRSQIHITSDASGDESLSDLVGRLRHFLEDEFWLLSFLMRQFVIWYEGQIWLKREDEIRGPVHVRLYEDFIEAKEQATKRRQEVYQLAVDITVLREGILERLIDNLKDSPYKDVIIKVIQGLLVVFEDNYLDVKLGVIYTLLEALVFGLGDKEKRFLMGNHKFRKFRNSVKKAVKVLAEDNEIEGSVLEEINQKIGELQRRPYKKHLLLVLSQYVKVEQFFPPIEDDNSGLQGAIRRRNLYIHQGKIEDFAQAQMDLYRIRSLIEITILSVLGYPLDKINRSAKGFEFILGRMLPKDYSFAPD